MNWIEIIEASRERILDCAVQAKKDTYGTMQGWHVDVEMNKNGECWVTGLESSGSQSISSYKGETFIVMGVDSWEIDTDYEGMIKDNKDLYKEFLGQKEEGYEYAYKFIQEKYPEIYKEWEDDTVDYEVDEFREVANMLIDGRIENETEYETHEE